VLCRQSEKYAVLYSKRKIVVAIGVNITDLGITRRYRERECAQLHWDEYEYGTVKTYSINV
jgi:hypothetical protein